MDPARTTVHSEYDHDTDSLRQQTYFFMFYEAYLNFDTLPTTDISIFYLTLYFIDYLVFLYPENSAKKLFQSIDTAGFFYHKKPRN
jgi:hypothetical protein